METIRDVENMFENASFHVYKDLNEKAGKLSKEAFVLHEGLLVLVKTGETGPLQKEDAIERQLIGFSSKSEFCCSF